MTATKKQLLPTEGDIMPTNHIENLILDIRGQQVMLDRDLANLYGVDTKVLNQAVKRNIERFPVHFRFQLSDLERDKLVTNCDRLQMLKHSNVNPFVFWGFFGHITRSAFRRTPSGRLTCSTPILSKHQQSNDGLKMRQKYEFMQKHLHISRIFTTFAG